MSVTELEKAVLSLGDQDLEAFATWFEEYLSDKWDRQIEADAAAGKLDVLARQALKDHAEGRSTPLRSPRKPL